MPQPFAFVADTTRYRPQNAYWMARCSQLAYDAIEEGSRPDEEAILTELKSWNPGFTKVIGFEKNSTQSFVARHERLIVVAFRGTDEFADWLDNVNLPAVPKPMGRVHRGFQMALDDVWGDMWQAVCQLKDNGQSLWLTGHSLGGALATLAAGALIDADQPFHGVYTFGQPRCVDQTYARFFNTEAKARFFRFQNNNDIVARIPQRLMGYSHVGSFIYIDVDKNLLTDISWWYRFVDRVRGDWQGLQESGVDWLVDHKMENYLKALEARIDTVPEGF